MRSPIIGVTSWQDLWMFPAGPLPISAVENCYTDGILAAGGLPMLLVNAHETVGRVVETVDGLLCIGGVDVDPTHYGQTPHPLTGAPDMARDIFEIALVREMVSRRMPVLAVCRGSQVVNVALGGTLDQHVDNHAMYGQPHEDIHAIAVAEGSLLASLCGSRNMVVNSLHHQAVSDLAPDLRIAAMADDGTVEAVEHVSSPLLAVQWHPERQTVAPTWAILTRWLVESAMERNVAEPGMRQ